MKTILVPTDFSKNASNGVRFAVLLAQKLQARLILLNALKVPAPAAEIPHQLAEALAEEKRAEATAKLDSECRKIRRAAGIECLYALREGDGLDAILDYAPAQHIDYIVIGTKGAGENPTGFFSNTASRLLAKTDIPVIVIPGKASISKNIDNITFATNYALTDIDDIARLRRLAGAIGAQVTVLHLSDEKVPVARQVQMMAEFRQKVNAVAAPGHVLFRVAPAQNSWKALEEYVNGHHTDMIAMSTHLRSTLDRLFTRSLTKRVALSTQIPLVVFHHKSGFLKLTP